MASLPPDDRKLRTRARIEETALALFRDRGFDRVTVEEVCAAAGVGPATFYRHFGTKDEVVFACTGAFTDALREAVAGADGLRSRRERLLRVLAGFARYLQDQQELLVLRDAIVRGHPALLRRTLVVQRAWEDELALGLAALRGAAEPDDTDHLDAALGLVLLRTGLRSWWASRQASLPEAVAEAAALAGAALAEDPAADAAGRGPGPGGH